MAVQLELNPIVIEQREDSIEEEAMKKESIRRAISRSKNTVNLVVFTFNDGILYPIQQMDKHATAEYVIEYISHQTNQPLLNGIFSIWMVSKHLQLQLKSYHQPVRLYKNWRQLLTQYTTIPKEQCINDKPRLYLRRNVHLTTEKEKDIVSNKISSNIIDFLYQEAVYNVTKGGYPPLAIQTAIELAGYQCAINFSDHDIKTNTIKERLKDFLPPYVTVGVDKKRIKSFDQLKGCGLEKDLFSVYDSCFQGNRLTMDEIKCKYLEKCWDLSFYGCVMFRGLVERKKMNNLMNFVFYRDRPVIVAINPSSIHILNETNKEILLYLKLSHDLSCDFQSATEEGEHFYSSLWLEFGTSSEMSKRLQIFSRQAPLMDAMIGRCLDVVKNSTTADTSLFCTQCTKGFVCETYACDSVTGNKVKLSAFSSLKRNLKTTHAAQSSS